MEDEILEINGKRYKRNTLIQFGRDHNGSAKKARRGGIVLSIFGLILVFLYVCTPQIVQASWLFFIIFPILLLFAFGGQTALILTAVVVSFFLLLGIGLLIYSCMERNEEYYVNIAKYYIEHNVKE